MQVPVVLLLVTSVIAAPRFNCPYLDTLVHIPDETDCTKFYKCDHGKAVMFSCPKDLIFNPKLEVCDWRYNVQYLDCDPSGFFSLRILRQDHQPQSSTTGSDVKYQNTDESLLKCHVLNTLN